MDGLLDKQSDRQMSVQGAYAQDAEIKGTRYEKDCWTTAGFPIDKLTNAVSTALARAGLVQFLDDREGGTYMLQFEVKQQRLTEAFLDLELAGLWRYTATIVVSYSVSGSHGEAPIWQEEIRGEQTVESGPKAAPRYYGSRSDQTAAFEGAVANNLEALIKRLRELQLDKDRRL